MSRALDAMRAAYAAAASEAILSPDEVAIGSIRHAITGLYQVYLSLYGNDLLWVGAYREREQAETVARVCTEAFAGFTGEAKQQAALLALLEDCERQGDAPATDPPPDQLRRIQAELHGRRGGSLGPGTVARHWAIRGRGAAVTIACRDDQPRALLLVRGALAGHISIAGGWRRQLTGDGWQVALEGRSGRTPYNTLVSLLKEQPRSALPAEGLIAVLYLACVGDVQADREWLTMLAWGLGPLLGAIGAQGQLRADLAHDDELGAGTRLLDGLAQHAQLSAPSSDGALIHCLLDAASWLWSWPPVLAEQLVARWKLADEQEEVVARTLAGLSALYRLPPNRNEADAPELRGVPIVDTPTVLSQALVLGPNWHHPDAPPIEHDALHWLCGGAIAGAGPVVGAALEAPRTLVADAARVEASALVASLLQAAQSGPHVPHGRYVVALPASLPTLPAFAPTLQIVARADGLWVRLVPADGWGVVVWWRPHIVMPDAWWCGLPWGNEGPLALVLHQVLAALWRDLRVAGADRVLIAPRQERTAGERAEPRARGRAVPTLQLPRQRVQRVALEPAMQWGSEADQAAIAGTARTLREHGVRVHLRQLHSGWKASEAQREAAEAFGLALPPPGADGRQWTVVRPYVRGADRADDVGVRVQARGLLALSLLLKPPTTDAPAQAEGTYAAGNAAGDVFGEGGDDAKDDAAAGP